jgi:FkbM family methyltransferase
VQRHPVARSALRLYDRLLGSHELPKEMRAVFRGLRPGTLAVDCGANVGRVTALLAERGADVYAFEPNPHAFAVLEQRFAANARVRCLPQAVTATAGVAQLHPHVDAQADPLVWSTGSSLFGTKPNVDADRFVEVETIDLDAFLDAFGRPVQVLKLDVEGSEVEILERFLESGRLTAIEHVLVEMHDRRIPGLEERGAALRRRLGDPTYRHVHLDWI